MPAVSARSSFWSSDIAILSYIAAITVLMHLATGHRYGFHRDELALLDDSRHLAWGYVAYPPITPMIGRLSLILSGTSLTGFRFFAAVAEAVAIVLTGLMAKGLGGSRTAQLIAATAVLPVCLADGTMMDYVPFDYLFWVLVAYFAIRLLTADDGRWWLAIGTCIGLGMMTKYTMGFFAIGIAVGVVLTGSRRYLENRWLWLGVGLMVLIFLPNLVWQEQNHFVSLDFLRAIHDRDVRIGRAEGFLVGQLNMTLLALPLWIAGLYFCLLSTEAKRFRILGYMYVVPLLLFLIARGRDYYLAPTYPMLYAVGSVFGERWLRSARRPWLNASMAIVWIALMIDVALAVAFFLPIAPIGSIWGRRSLQLQGNFREEIGWQELVQTVAGIRDSLPAEDRQRMGILAGNYGEAGAVDLYGPEFSLPRAISGMNSYWQQGYGTPPPETLIVIGISPLFLRNHFTSCEFAGHNGNRFGVANEEAIAHPDIYVCRGLRQSWQQFWAGFRYFG